MKNRLSPDECEPAAVYRFKKIGHHKNFLSWNEINLSQRRVWRKKLAYLE